MKKRRKTEKCLNCGRNLDLAFNFCPECGQENTNNQISFGKLLNDFFSNYFSLDSRFGRSFKPFFLHPGLLTREFMIGRRVQYANPIRLYLVVSLIHFFVLSIYANATTEKDDGKRIIDIGADKQAADSITSSDTIIDTGTSDFIWLNGNDWATIQKMSADGRYTIDDIADSLNLQQQPYFQQYVTRQAIKVIKSDQSSIRAYILENVPVLLFLLLPVYALLLKLLFRKRLYINHLVHSLHIHSFIMIILTLYWLAAFFVGIPKQINILLFFLLTLYIVASFKNTYAISKWPAAYKVFLSGFVYGILLFFALVLEMVISLLTF